MSFDWTKYYDLASELCNTREEAYMRSAISRSYYCAFNVARNYLKSKNRDYRMDDHVRLWSQVRKVSGNIEIQTLGQRIKKIRTKADYEFDFPKIEEELKVVMINSKNIVDIIGRLDCTPD